MGLLDTILSTIDAKKRSAKRGIMDMLDNPSQWAGMQANRIQEDRYGGADNAQAMKQYLSKQPYDKKALTAANDALRNAAINESLGAVTAWHGSPHKFDKFDMSKIGTGEGAQAYGHGLYLAESPGVAKSYADNLAQPALVKDGNKIAQVQGPQTAAQARFMNAPDDPVMQNVMGVLQKHNNNYDDAIKALDSDPRSSWEYADEIDLLKAWKSDANRPITDPGKHLYKVDIPDEAVAKFLDWDKPLSEQAPEVQSAISKMRDKFPISKGGWDIKPWMDADPLASTWHNEAVRELGVGQDFFTKNLSENGVPGIRYLDGGSRSAGQGSSNYVLFDDQLPRILERNGQPTGLQPWAKGEWKGLLDEPAPKLTEFEQRHLTAQKNAALPVEQGGLGLPPNNTAMDRARAMGFDTPAYHGTMRDFDKFSNEALGANTGAKSATMAHFFAKSPDTPNSYLPQWGMGKNWGTHLDSPPVYAKLMEDKDAFARFNAADESERWRILEELGLNHGRGRVIPVQLNLGKNIEKDYGGSYRDVAYAEVLKKAKKGNKDSVSFLRTHDPGGEWGSNYLPNNETIYAVMKPENIRSRFAAFDPKRRHEADLLGYADPYLLGAMGAGGLLGMGGYSMMNDK